MGRKRATGKRIERGVGPVDGGRGDGRDVRWGEGALGGTGGKGGGSIGGREDRGWEEIVGR